MLCPGLGGRAGLPHAGSEGGNARGGRHQQGAAQLEPGTHASLAPDAACFGPEAAAAGERGCAGLQGLDRFGKELLAARNPFAAGAARRPMPLALLFHGAGSPASPASPASLPGAQAAPPLCALYAKHHCT